MNRLGPKRELRAPFVVVATFTTLATLGPLAIGCGSGAGARPDNVVGTGKPVAAVAPPENGDRDGDDIADANDPCPEMAEDKDGFEDTDGCPDPDNDRDAIPDLADKCPNDPEVYNGVADDDGCPDKTTVYIPANPPSPAPVVQFASAATTPTPASLAVIDEVAQVMKGHPEVEIVEIAGHAADPGSAAKNVQLSLARAKTVVAMLIERGVDPARLRVSGYGNYCPTELAQKAGAADANRRVDFKVLWMNGAATGVVTGCPAAAANGIPSPKVP